MGAYNYILELFQYVSKNHIELVIMFAFYSCVGWIYESTICSFIAKHHFVNRGYLNGPLCPIYGCGAIINAVVLRDINSILCTFLIAAVSSVFIEYITSYTMEKLFHARWWDYSRLPYNLNGRVCLYGFILFGLGNVVIIHYLQPIGFRLLSSVNLTTKMIFANAFMILFISDLIISTIDLYQLKEKFDHIRNSVKGLMKNKAENSWLANNIDVTWKNNTVVIKIQNFKESIKNNELRLIKAFPNMKIKKEDGIINKIIEKIKENKT